ncbi:ABC transporter ATP-binding protein [Thalassovita mangrovi]|uniref:ATP-binding cassette domain-containing protein n=1 Tax=Thalassovita mangrovi TaxID=2692236 RepID=A0A6L8LQV4_9RHOB|nr:ABC transporter ATP-binding protein [Thalassovita mangrovi]MYM55882.1 ATP-binding cassette domain-containing protein [Thalassovita mangrovi]
MSNEPLLSVSGLSVTLRGRPVLSDVSFDVGPHEVIGLIGANGAGKTTLMRACLGLIDHRGHSSLADLPPQQRSKMAAWMPQAREIAWPVTVETLVMLGRIPHLDARQRPSQADCDAVDQVLKAMGLEEFRQRTATRLSGGEQARALLARAMAQDTPLLMADEPIAGLDPAHQISTMQSFARLAQAGRSVIVSLHDLGLAARHCTRLIVLDKGRITADGAPGDVLTPDLIRDTFGITAWYENTDQGPVFQPLEVLE